MPHNGDDACRNDLPSRRSLLGVSAALIASILARPSGAETAQQVGSVEDFKGQVFAEKDAVRRDLERAAPLFVRDQVGTGAELRLTMRLGRDTILKLGEQARLTIDRYLVDAGGELNLGSGAMLFERPAGRAPTTVRIRSTFGLIAVRGTRFFAGPSNEVFGVFVQEGRVTVSAAGKRVTVRAGQGTNIARPGAAPTTPAPWRDPRINAALASVS